MTRSCSAWNCHDTLDVPAFVPARAIMSPQPQDLCEGPKESAWRLETLGKVTEGVVHDFNNILAAISGFAELILNAETDPQRENHRRDVANFAHLILEAAGTGHSTLRSLRSLARQGKRETEPLDVHEVVDSCLSMVRGVLGGRISVATDFQVGVFQIQGCRALLQNAFINLFLNARDAMPQGGHIQVRSFSGRMGASPGDREAGWATLSVRDDGEGMPPDVRERIFDRFFTTKGENGNGLGLANVRETILAHGGCIRVESAPGAGAEFRIELPILP